MSPRTAPPLTLVLALAGAIALIPLLGLFGVPPSVPGAQQTWLALTAMICLISGMVLAGYGGPADDPAQRPMWLKATRRVLDLALGVLTGIIFLPSLHDSIVGGPRPEWLDRVSSLLSALWQMPHEMAMLIPLFITGYALWRHSRQAGTPA